jgi:hypothetical protein
MLHYALASSLRVHGDSSGDGSETSLSSPENKCTGSQPVFQNQCQGARIRRAISEKISRS